MSHSRVYLGDVSAHYRDETIAWNPLGYSIRLSMRQSDMPCDGGLDGVRRVSQQKCAPTVMLWTPCQAQWMVEEQVSRRHKRGALAVAISEPGDGSNAPHRHPFNMFPMYQPPYRGRISNELAIAAFDGVWSLPFT